MNMGNDVYSYQDILEKTPDYECEKCWDRGCDCCTFVDPITGMLIPIKQDSLDEEYEIDTVIEHYVSEIDELCMECHDPDCDGCNE